MPEEIKEPDEWKDVYLTLGHLRFSEAERTPFTTDESFPPAFQSQLTKYVNASLDVINVR